MDWLNLQTKTPQTPLSHGTFVEQPSPEVCSPPAYLTIDMTLLEVIRAGFSATSGQVRADR